MIGLALLFQLATVGDTMWVRREIAVPPGRAVRAADWEPGEDVELLGRPRVTLRGDSAEVAYPVTVWAPGTHELTVPGPLLVGPDGTLDSLPTAAVTLVAASVLPAQRPDTGLRPQPAAAGLPLYQVSPTPLLILWAGALMLLAPLHVVWRRRGLLRPVAPVGDPPAADPPVERWAEAGEDRAVVGAAAARLREAIAARIPDAGTGLETDACLARIAERGPDWPLAELADLLHALDHARFAQGMPDDPVALYRRAADLERRLPAAA